MKRGLKILLIIIGLIIVMGLAFFAVDYFRVQKQEEPIFCIKTTTHRDGGTQEYLGLGYKIIDFNTLNGYDEMKIETWFMNYEDFQNEMNSQSTINAIIVNVNDNSLGVVRKDDLNEIMIITTPDADKNEYKENEEILIYFDGTILETYPAQVNNVSKIEIVSEKSNETIPTNVLIYFNNSKDNLDVTVDNISNSEIIINIKDTNEIKYEFSNEYSILKKNEDTSQEEPEIVVSETSNSTSSSEGSGVPIWEEVSKISDIESRDTVKSDDVDEQTKRMIFNFEELYGVLKDGKYEFVLSSTDTVAIRIYFEVKEDENVENIEINVE